MIFADLGGWECWLFGGFLFVCWFVGSVVSGIGSLFSGAAKVVQDTLSSDTAQDIAGEVGKGFLASVWDSFFGGDD